jgi:GMP synthase (glutamine-hydrolysing)
VSKLLVFQHVAYEILGTLNPLFKSAGYRIRYVNFGRHPHAEPRLDGYQGLVILGGPMNVDEVEQHPHLATEVRAVREAIERGIPILGICLGAQLIAKALGARVERACEKEIGWYDLSVTPEAKRDPLLSHFDATEKIFQWHGDTFEIPCEAVHLATSPACSNQAFRYRDNVYGFQFHLEVDEPMIDRWLQVPVHRREIESLNGKVCPDRIRAETAKHLNRLKELSERTFGEFVRMFGPRKKRIALPSR